MFTVALSDVLVQMNDFIFSSELGECDSSHCH